MQEALGVDTPLVCSALSLAIESVLTATADELGSLSVVFNASSSLGLATQGELESVRVRAAGWSSGGLRASEIAIDASDIKLVPLNPLNPMAQQLPNLARPAELAFSLRFSQDDLNRSPVLFALLQELLPSPHPDHSTLTLTLNAHHSPFTPTLTPTLTCCRSCCASYCAAASPPRWARCSLPTPASRLT